MVYDLLGQCLNQIIVLEKRALRLINFAQAGEQAIPFFLKRKLLPLGLPTWEKSPVSCINVVNTSCAPINFSILPLKSSAFDRIE